jgi:hypothetical protein
MSETETTTDAPEAPAAAAPAEAEPKAAKPPKPPKAKAEKAKKAKPAKGATAGDGAKLPSIANHPRAGAQIGRAKSWGGLLGFMLVAVLSWRAGVPAPDLMLRALLGGVAGYVVAWASAVAIWRHLVIAELRAVRVRRAAVQRARSGSSLSPGGR